MDTQREPAPILPKILADLSNRECHHPVKEDRQVLGHWLFCAAPADPRTRLCPAHSQTYKSATQLKGRRP